MGVFGALKSAVKKPVQAANKLVNKAPGMNKLGAAVGKAPGMTALGQAAGLGPTAAMTPRPPINAINPGPPQPMGDIPSGPMIQPNQPGPLMADNAPPMMGGGQAFGQDAGGMMPPPNAMARNVPGGMMGPDMGPQQATGIGPSPQSPMMARRRGMMR